MQDILNDWLAAFERARQVVSSYVTAGPDDVARRAEAMRDIPVQRMAIATLRRELADIAERLPAATSSATDPQVEIGGRAYRVTGRFTVDDYSPRAAELYRRDGIVAKVQLMLARGGRKPYVAYQRQDGSYSRPWRGQLVAAN